MPAAHQRSATLVRFGMKPKGHAVERLAVSRDPNDDYVIATAIAASVAYLVTKDKDLLTLKTYRGVQMIRPEEFSAVVRQQNQKS